MPVKPQTLPAVYEAAATAMKGSLPRFHEYQWAALVAINNLAKDRPAVSFWLH